MGLEGIEARKFKDTILRLLESDREFRYALMGLLGFKELLERFTKLEERQQRLEERFAKLEERFARIEERQQVLEERLARLEERVTRVEERLELLVKELISLRRTVITVARRFGLMTEYSFREAIKGILSKYFGATAERMTLKDDEGVVFGYPSVVDIDVIIKDNVHIVVEVKSEADDGDVLKLVRVGELYRRKRGVRPKLAIVAGWATQRAREVASRLGVEIYAYLEEGLEV